MYVRGVWNKSLPYRNIPINPSPKIFFRYYLVDSSTGVKSQTMLAECKWAAAAAAGGEP